MPGGFTGAGAKTVIPAKATAKVSMRIVPDMKPEELDRLIHRYFERELSPEEEILLATLIRMDREVADRFVELSELESAMVESLHAEEAAPPDVVTPMRNSRRRTRVLQAPVARPVWPLFFAAAFLIGFLGILVNSVRQPAVPTIVRTPSVVVEVPAPEKAPLVNPLPSRRPEASKPAEDFVTPPFAPKKAENPSSQPQPASAPKPEEKRPEAPKEKPAPPGGPDREGRGRGDSDRDPVGTRRGGADAPVRSGPGGP